MNKRTIKMLRQQAEAIQNLRELFRDVDGPGTHGYCYDDGEWVLWDGEKVTFASLNMGVQGQRMRMS